MIQDDRSALEQLHELAKLRAAYQKAYEELRTFAFERCDDTGPGKGLEPHAALHKEINYVLRKLNLKMAKTPESPEKSEPGKP